MQWRGPRAEKGHARWESTVRAAAKQSRRAFVPEVSAVLDSVGVAQQVAELVVVGPEGGIADRELDLFRDAGAVLTVLGPHVLRTSTAGPVAVAMLAERLGRWE